MSLESTLAAVGIVPVVVLDDAADAQPLGRALVSGGLPVAEVTLRTPAALKSIAAMAEIEGLVVGAGTVTSAEQVDQAIDVGATFVVSPGLSRAVVDRCRERGVPVLPGVATPSDIIAAQELGLDIVKFFPAQAYGGATTVKALSAPFAGMRFVPTGGINLGNVGEYFALPSVLAVGGSWMVEKSMIAQGQWERLEEEIRGAAALVRTR